MAAAEIMTESIASGVPSLHPDHLSLPPLEQEEPGEEMDLRLQEAEDALAHKTAALADLGSMLKRQAAEIVALEKQCGALRAQAAQQPGEADPTKARTERSRADNLERIIRARDEGIAYLRGEVAEKLRRMQRMEKEVSRAQKASAKLAKQLEKLRKENGKLAKQLEKSKVWKLRNWFKRLRGRPPETLPVQTAKVAEPPVPSAKGERIEVTKSTPPLPEPPADKDRALTILPEIPADDLQDIINRVPAQQRAAAADIISFSIVDWEFRFQRPQQLMAEFAARGHRVFYISVSRFEAAESRPRFTVRELRKNLYEVSLATERAPEVYGEIIGGGNADALLASIEDLRRAFHIEDAISWVSVPSWCNLALATRHRWGWRVVYDCMDEWADFDVIHPVLLEAEEKLVTECDLLVVTAQRLQDKWKKQGRDSILVRNAVDYDFYEQQCRPNSLLQDAPHPVIGYYGGIADWFDAELMARVARARPGWTFVLIGGVFNVDMTELEALPNVRLLGQQPYETMPLYLYHFDVCIIPFKINAITEATDPVKFYEYVSWGKPVVSTMLPELNVHRDHLYLARDADDFVVKIEAALVENDAGVIERRRALARQHTWRERVGVIKAGLTSTTPKASIIIVTYNGLALTKLCLESVLRNTSHANFEIIVVDNHSVDGTPAYLRHLARSVPNLRVILNPENRGFAAANNQGIAAATGEHLVLLNNDTIVPPAWLQRLLHHLQDLDVGLVGPMTNFVGNEAKLSCSYKTIAEMESFARSHTWQRDGEAADIAMLAMFCVAFRRATLERVGPLDEQFGIGMFEDDDYAMRIRQAGLKVVCAADVFVHHFGQAAFGKLIDSGEYNPLFERNRALFEAKWKAPWRAHQHGQLNFTRHF